MVQRRVAVVVLRVHGCREFGMLKQCGQQRRRVRVLGRERQRVQAGLVDEGNAAREVLDEHDADLEVSVFRREHERRVVVDVAADFQRVMAG